MRFDRNRCSRYILINVSTVILFYAIGCSFSCTAQAHYYDLSGIITVNGLNNLSYKMVFSVTAGTIKGYSLTNIGRKDEAKAIIQGHIDKEKQSITFDETGIIHSASNDDSDIICMVHAKLKYKKGPKGMMFVGTFKGRDFNSGKDCATGDIVMLSTDALNQLFKPLMKKDSSDCPTCDTARLGNSTLDQLLGSSLSNNTSHSNEEHSYSSAKQETKLDTFTAVDEITAGIQTVYDWLSDTVIIDIWDGGSIDYDMVTIVYNTDTLLKNYTLKAQKKRLKAIVRTIGEDDLLTIIAENEGNEPPNTADLTLIDGDKKYNIEAHNNTGQKAVIRIRKKR